MNNMNSDAEIKLMLHLMGQVALDDDFPQDIRIVFGTILVAFGSIGCASDDIPNIDNLREKSVELFEVFANVAAASGLNKELKISNEITEALKK